jgi:hypothetical protein
MNLSMTITPALLAIVGTLLAAFIAGFFSFLNLVSSKETKVSGFRLSWIDGLREEVSAFTSAVHEMIRIEDLRTSLSDRDFLEISAGPYKIARENLSKIQLRLNPKHAQDKTKKEGIVWGIVVGIRELFNDSKYDDVIKLGDELRKETSFLLKAEWVRVKKGENTFRAVKWTAVLILVGAFAGLAYAVSVILSVGHPAG